MIKDTIVLILCIIIYFGCLIELIRIKMCKININDYFYCALNNKIYMKSSMISKKKWKSLKREENKERIFYGFDKLAENKIYKLITHKAMIYRLMACEELGYITIIKIKKHVFPKNIVKLEKQLGAKKVNKKLKNMYFVKIKTTKNIKNYNINELKKIYYKICRKKLEIKEP